MLQYNDLSNSAGLNVAKRVYEMIYGYCRVSTDEQKNDRQHDELRKAGVPARQIFSEKISGGVLSRERPVLGGILKKIQPGDTLTVTMLDRLGRDAADTQGLLRDLRAQGVGVRILGLGVETSGAAGELIIGVLANVAQWERKVIKERTKSGLEAAWRRGSISGRRPSLSPEGREEVVRAYYNNEPVSAIARRYRVSRATVHRVVANAKKASIPEQSSATPQ